MKRTTPIAILWMLLLGAVVFAQEPPAVIDAYRSEPKGDNQFRKRGIMDGNLIRTMYFNQAEIGKWPDQPSGEWGPGGGKYRRPGHLHHPD